MHQPIQSQLDETSSESNVSGGTLTNAGPLGKSITNIPTIMSYSDEMSRQLEYYKTLTIDASTRGFLFGMDPMKCIFPWSTGTQFMPWKFLPMLTCNYYDFGYKLCFTALKHEKARGKILFLWFPGVTSDFEATTNITYSTDPLQFPAYLLEAGGTASVQPRVQRWIWDIEKGEEFTLTLFGANLRVLRPTIDTQIVTPTAANNYIMYNGRLPTSPQSMGILMAYIYVPYSPGAICPQTLDIIMMNQLVNLQTSEYKSPLGAIDRYTYNFRN